MFTGDHVSFHDGKGYDGLIEATSLVAASRRLTVWTAVYLLALRHPVPVARSLASIASIAQGRFVFGVGLGGEDPHELQICGVDPSTRGRRLDSHLDVIDTLMSGAQARVDNGFLSIPDAVIRPVPSPRIPLLIGGRSRAALRRVGRVGNGWIAIWVTPDRARSALAVVAEEADAVARSIPDRNALMVWCGLGRSAEHARSMVSPVMEDLYKIPFARFERFTPCGTAADVAGAIAPYLELGFNDILLNGVAEDRDALIGLSDEVARLLAG
ncbi:hypothetical protein A5653_25855 [Mycobacterium colombiense]|nr:hypothetical protein A5653_25855 [Mycobacterium colombiense]